MPYTFKALALLWFAIFGLAGLALSGLLTGPWVLLAVAAALAAPALILSRRAAQSPALAVSRPADRRT